MSRFECRIEGIAERILQPVRRLIGQPQSNGLASPGGDGESVMGRSLGATQLGVDCVLVPVDDSLDDAVLAERLWTGLIEGSLSIGFVFSEQQIDDAFTVKESLSKKAMPGGDGAHIRARR